MPPPSVPAPHGTTGNGWPLLHRRYYLREHDLGLGRREPKVGRYLPGQVEV